MSILIDMSSQFIIKVLSQILDMPYTQKDKGNAFFKKSQYSQAITHYQNYVKQSHDDNKNAYFNLSLCHSKLGRPKLSVEAAEKAIEIDRNYTKCYYRLVQEYKKIAGKQYEVFINAVKFQKFAEDDQGQQKQQMKKVAAQYRERFIRLPQKQQLGHPGLQTLIKTSQSLVQQRELTLQVDKYLSEWISQWNTDTQSEEAKWIEIQYIIEEIDYEYGINLAYFYINRLKDKELKQKTLKELQELRERLGKDTPVDIEELQIKDQGEKVQEEESQFTKQDDEEEQNLFEEQKQPERQNKPQKPQKSLEKINLTKPEKQKSKNPLQAIQKKINEKNKVSQLSRQQDLVTVTAANSKINKKVKQFEKRQTEKQQRQTHSKKSDIYLPTSSQVTKKVQTEDTRQPQKKTMSSGELDDLYDTYCGGINKKNIFTALYQSLFKILQEKSLDTVRKGSLIVQLRKRLPKFKIIMGSNSQNEQKVLFDLLVRNNMEEYAGEIAPKYEIK